MTYRKKYQKEYYKKNYNKLRSYKTEWARLKRLKIKRQHMLEIYVETPSIDHRAKQQCVLCWNFIDKKDYLIYGNYCTRCNTACTSLSKIYPYDIIENPTDKEEYEERRSTKVKWYTKETNNFQYFLTENRKRMKEYLAKNHD